MVKSVKFELKKKKEREKKFLKIFLRGDFKDLQILWMDAKNPFKISSLCSMLACDLKGRHHGLFTGQLSLSWTVNTLSWMEWMVVEVFVG